MYYKINNGRLIHTLTSSSLTKDVCENSLTVTKISLQHYCMYDPGWAVWGGGGTGAGGRGRAGGLKETLEIFSIRFFKVNGKRQTWGCHVTTVLRLCLQFAVHVSTARRASSGKWFTARFFAFKNCTASRLKSRNRFLYPPAMYLLDFRTRINELFMFFRR